MKQDLLNPPLTTSELTDMKAAQSLTSDTRDEMNLKDSEVEKDS